MVVYATLYTKINGLMLWEKKFLLSPPDRVSLKKIRNAKADLGPWFSDSLRLWF